MSQFLYRKRKMLPQYSNPHLPYPDQIALLKTLNLIVSNDNEAERILQKYGFQRFSYYLYTFRSQTTNPKIKSLKSNITLGEIEKLIIFDEKLRNLCFEACTIFEINLRSIMSYQIGEIDKFGYINSNLINNDHLKNGQYDSWVVKYDEDYNNAKTKKEPIIKSFEQEYNGDLPIWKAVQILSFGTLIKLYGILKPDIRSLIALKFGCKSINDFRQVCWAIGQLRNTCAHHGRLWNASLSSNPSKKWNQSNIKSNRLDHLNLITLEKESRIYLRLTILSEFIRNSDPIAFYLWRDNFIKHVNSLNTILGHTPEDYMGYPNQWMKLDIWSK